MNDLLLHVDTACEGVEPVEIPWRNDERVYCETCQCVVWLTEAPQGFGVARNCGLDRD